MSKKIRRSREIRLIAFCVAGALPLVNADTTLAQEAAKPSDTSLEEIVVTATKRETRLQATPLAISSFSSETLQTEKIETLKDLAAISPGLIVGANAGQEVPIAIRGISSGDQGVGGDSPVAVYLDGVYIGQTYAAIFSLADIDRIEVARGPQGTLYGRNSTAGAINVITAQPSSEQKASLLVRYGDYNNVDVVGSAQGPVADSDKLFFKIGAAVSSIDGWQHLAAGGQPVNGQSSHTVDAGLRYLPTDDLSFDLRVDHNDTDLPTYLRILSPGVEKYGLDRTPLDSNLIYADGNQFYSKLESDGIGLTAKYSMDDVTIKSITGYRYFSDRSLIDNDWTDQSASGFQQDLTARQFSEEINLTSEGSTALKWIVGAYYYNELAKDPYIQAAESGRGNSANIVNASTSLQDNTLAAFGNATYDITDQLSVGGGIRFSYESKNFGRLYYLGTGSGLTMAQGTVMALNPTPLVLQPGNDYAVSKRWRAITPRGEIDYHFTPDIFAYASVSSGEKSGGYSFSGTTTSPDGPVFAPENIIAYEVGLKSTVFDHQLRVNFDFYHYDYSGLQVAVATSSAVRTIYNAGSATVNGFETEFEFVPHEVPGLRLSGNLSFMPDAKYNRFTEDLSGDPAVLAAGLCPGGALETIGGKMQQCNLAGNRLPRAPKIQFYVAAEYRIPVDALAGSLTPRLAVTHQSSVYYTEQNVDDGASTPFTDVDLQLRYEPNKGDWEFTAWCKNLTDERHVDNSRATNVTFPGTTNTYFVQYGFASAPRVFGVEFKQSF